MKKGFSLLEVISSIVILLVLVAVIIGAFRGFRNEQVLNSAAEQIVALIDEARFKTLASKKSSQYGVHFEANRAVFFEGTGFAESDPNNEEFTISTLAEISSVALNGGGTDLVFQKLTGETNQYGVITVRIKNDISKTKDIVIESTGIVNVQF